MNINGYVPLLINTLYTIARKWKYLNYLWRWCFTWSRLPNMGAGEAQNSRHETDPPRVLYCHLQHPNDTIIKAQEDFFRKIFVPLTLFVRVRKGCVGFYCERELETEQKLQYFDPHSYGRQRCVFLVLQGCSTGGPEAHSVGWWLSLLHLISNFPGPQLIRAPRPLRPDVAFLTTSRQNSVRSLTATNCNSSGAPRAPSAWCGFPYHISYISGSYSNWNSLISVLTESYNSSTSTQSPNRFLKSHIWSSSSGNNCHAVHRSISSGASVYECTMGIFFSPSHFISQFPPMRFPLITAIRMCHPLPVHHLGMAFLAGSKVKI